jgi:hypothetical protein
MQAPNSLSRQKEFDVIQCHLPRLNLELIRETIIITAVTLATSQMEEDVACLLVLTVVEHKRKLVRIE